MKYLRTFFLALQSEFLSRANLFGWFIVGTIPSISLLLVWFAILGDRESINGFTKGDFVTYYIFITLSWYIVGGTFGRTIGYGIKEGIVSTTLLKPYDVILGQGIQEQAWKILSIFVALPATFFIVFLMRSFIQIHLSFEQVLLLIISLILGGINFAILEALVGLSSFWITENWPAAHINDIFQALFGGRYVPIALMPPALLFISNLLPFKYTFYVPVSILLQKSASPLLDIGIQFLYVIILFGIYKFVWIMGIRKYEAIGI